MVFYNGRAPNGRKTEWKMNEYKAIEAHHADQNQPLIASSSSNAPSAPTVLINHISPKLLFFSFSKPRYHITCQIIRNNFEHTRSNPTFNLRIIKTRKDLIYVC